MEQKRPADIFQEFLDYLWNGLGLEEKGWKRLKKGDFKKKMKNGLTYQVWFDRSRYNTDWDGNELLLSDILGTDEDLVLKPIEDDVDRQLLMDAVDKLTARERTIITLRFGLGGREEKTQKEVADMMGISQSYISRLEKRIIVRLKKEILKMS